MAAPQAALLIMPSIAIGLVIGLYEALLIHRDVSIPLHRFGHMLHALVIAMAAVFINMNVPFVLALVPALKSVPVIAWNPELVIRSIVALIMLFKIHASSSVLKGSGMSSAGTAETWTHSLVVAALVVAAPYVYPFIAPGLPAWMQR